MTPQRVALSYALAVGTACPLAYGLGKVDDTFLSAHCVYYIAHAGVMGTEVAGTAVFFVSLHAGCVPEGNHNRWRVTITVL